MVCKLESRSNLLMMCRMLKNKGITKVENKSALGYLVVDKVPGSSIYRRPVGCHWKCLPLPLTLDGSQNPPDGSRSSQSLPSALSVPLPRPYSRIHDYWQNSSSVFSRPNVNANNSRFDKSNTCLCLDCFQQFKKSVNMITSTFIAHAMYRLT